jgi:hypothetical protein
VEWRITFFVRSAEKSPDGWVVHGEAGLGPPEVGDEFFFVQHGARVQRTERPFGSRRLMPATFDLSPAPRSTSATATSSEAKASGKGRQGARVAALQIAAVVTAATAKTFA